MITSNVIHRVFRIRYGGSACTGFTIEVEGREYLVTAKHGFVSLGGSDEIDVFSNGDWSPYEVNLVGHAPDDVDITVLAATQRLTPPGLPMDATQAGLIYGQEVYFLGFPYNFLGKFVLGDLGYPLPFVKKATLSLFDDKIVFLDGHNNPGFSGGPVVFTEPTKREYKVAAVISGYRAVEEPVYDGDTETGLTYRYNTGIIVAHNVIWALDLIHANPIGYEIT